MAHWICRSGAHVGRDAGCGADSGRARARGTTMATALYEDRWITCEPDRLVIRGYYFPFGSKVIAYRDIHGITPVALRLLGGSWRIWGATDPRYWFHLDPG